MSTLSFSQSSDLAVGVEEVLPTLTMQGVNAELWPILRMTSPGEWKDRPIFEWPVNQLVFESWILLLGALPVDRHRFYFHSISPGKGFAETSSSMTNAQWNHERSIVTIAGGCRVTDSVEYQCRLPLLGYALKPVYQLVFWCRHRNLKSKFGKHPGI
jgi:hypothetical protein